MNYLFYQQIFETPSDNGSDRWYFFCKYLVSKGHRVTVLTSDVDYKKAEKRDQSRDFKEEAAESLTLKYINTFSNFRGSYLKRIWFYLSFISGSIPVLIKKGRHADCIYAVSTPLTVPAVACLIGRLVRTPVVVEITDVWPDAAVHTGVLKNSIVIKAAKLIEAYVYRRASKLVCLTEGVAEIVRSRTASSEKIITITNGADPDLFLENSLQDRKCSRDTFGFSGKIVALYLGAHGRYNALETIIDAADILKNHSQIQFVLVGDGDEKSRMQSLAIKKGLRNVTFLDPVPRRTAIKMLVAADLCLLPNLSGDFYRCNLPNKVFDYLASGNKVVTSGATEAARIIIDADAGAVVEAQNSEEFAAAVLSVASEGGDDTRLRRRIQDYTLARFSRVDLAKRLEVELLKICSSDEWEP